VCFQRQSSFLQSPDWSHVANPSRCQFCRSDCHLSSDQLYPEPAALQLAALTQLPRLNRPKYRGHDDDVTVGPPGLQCRGPQESVRWWWAGGDERCWWWTDSAAETISVPSTSCASGGSGTGFGASSFNSLELSDLEPTGCETPGRRVDQLMVDTVGGRRDTSRRRGGSASGGEWVVRRRSDGSRYIGRRRPPAETHRHDADPARRSSPRSTSHQTPGAQHHQHGATQSDRCYDSRPETEDVFHSVTTLDRWTSDDYGTVEWICSPHCIDSNYCIVAVI